MPGALTAWRGSLSCVMELRVLTVGDWCTWRQLRLAALAEAPYAFGSRLADWQGDGDREERWRERLAIPGSVNVVAVVDGQPAGMVSGVLAGEGAAEMISLWVSPAVRGRGGADQLGQAVGGGARGIHAGVLLLAVTPGNENAVALYRRHGFSYTGQAGELMPDGVHRELLMARTLTETADAWPPPPPSAGN